MRDPAHEVEAFRAARQAVIERIAAACVRVGRDPAEVTLVAVAKTVEPDRLRRAVEAGLDVLGENRVQEGADKRPQVDGVTWHLIGPLQSNKARKALQVFDVIESVATIELGERLDRLAGEVRPDERFPVLVQVNVDEDPAKAGVQPEDAGALIDRLLALPRLDVRGLMTIGRFGVAADETRRTFRTLHDLRDRLRLDRPALGTALSMGMSDDFELAVEEGATIVRVGRAIFGERDHDHGGGPHRH